jgi:hypothetical protein
MGMNTRKESAMTAEKNDETRLNIPMTKAFRQAIETHWRTIAGVTSAADYMRQLAEKDMQSHAKR